MGALQSDLKFDLTTTGIKSGKTNSQIHSKIVIFGENTETQVAYLLDDVSSRSRTDNYNLKLKVHSTVEDELLGCPVIGLAQNRMDPVQNRSLFLWNLFRGIVNFKGSSESVHKVKSGGEILIHFILSSGKLSLTITNPEEKSITKEIDILPHMIPSVLVPYVGVMKSDGSMSSSFTTFSILDIVSKIENDISEHVAFKKCYGTIEVSPNQLKVWRKATQQGNGCALLPVKIFSGIHRWTFTVHTDIGASLCVGLARYPFKLLEEYIDDKMKHIYRHPGLMVYRSYKGLLYREGKELNYSLGSLSWIQGHTILLELVYNANEGKMEILKNGESLGVAFEGLTGPFQPVVCFYAAHEKNVELKRYMTTEPLDDVLVVMLPFSSLEKDGADQEVIKHIEDFCFDESSLYGKLEITSDKKAVFRTDSQSGDAFCFANIQCSNFGIYRFSFVIEVDKGASTCIGVTSATSTSQVMLADHLYNSKDLCLYRSFQGLIYIDGKEQPQKFEEFWISGTMVEMEINITCDESFVCFKINAKDQGVAFSRLQPPLTPVVAFYAGMEKRVTFLHFEFQNIRRTSSRLLSRGISSGLNNTDINLTHAPLPLLSPLASLSDAVEHSLYCVTCRSEVDVIALPCKHAFLCSKHLSIGLNAATPRCPHCDKKITQIWNVLLPRKL